MAIYAPKQNGSSTPAGEGKIYAPPLATFPQPFGGIVRADIENVQGMSAQTLDAHIRLVGVPCELWEMVRCPCVYPERLTAVPDCLSCHGTGRYYPEGRRSQVTALVTGRSAERRQLTAGESVSGSVEVTLPTGTTWRKGYLILPEGQTHSVNDHLIRAGRMVDPEDIYPQMQNPYAQPALPAPTSERLTYPRVLEMQQVYWGGGSKPVSEAIEGIDYLFVDGVIQWLEGRGPQPGDAYSVVYLAPAVYMLDDPRQRQQGKVVLPQWCNGNRLDMAREARLGG